MMMEKLNLLNKDKKKLNKLKKSYQDISNLKKNICLLTKEIDYLGMAGDMELLELSYLLIRVHKFTKRIKIGETSLIRRKVKLMKREKKVSSLIYIMFIGYISAGECSS